LTTLLKRPIRNRETSPVDIDIETPTQRAFVDETALPETHSQIGEPRMNTTEHGCLPVPPDGDLPTLHIRCGSDIRESLRQAGFAGDFLEYSDPICQGPVPGTPDLLQRRARYLARSCGSIMGFTEAQSLAGLEAAERRLNEAHTYPRVVLWFEHDSYDQLLLARCLAHFAEGPPPAHLELICIDRHPSVERFLGLGQLARQPWRRSGRTEQWSHRRSLSWDGWCGPRCVTQTRPISRRSRRPERWLCHLPHRHCAGICRNCRAPGMGCR
jgi:hypothetical protein